MNDEEEEKTKEPLELQFFHLKKKLLLAAMFLRFFFCGAEYSVILPTALIYLQSLNADHLFMGLVVAAYPFAAMISLPLTGYVYDRTKRTKEMLLLLNAFELVGNILYALPYSKWLPLTGRFLAGFGDGFLSLAVGEFTFLYSRSARIGIFSILELGRVLGLILGPTLNLFIANKSYDILGWVLDNKTLPGALMAINWGIMQIITIVCVHNLALESTKLVKADRGEETPLISSETSSEINAEGLTLTSTLFEPDDSSGEENGDLESTASAIEMIQDNEELQQKLQSEHIADEMPVEKQNSLLNTLKELMHWEFMIICIIDIVLWYSQTVFEIFMPYITEFDYHWTPAMTGLVYMFGGIVLIIVFGLLMLTAGKIKDTTLIIVALILTQATLALLIYESTLQNLHTRYILFVIICILLFSTVPLNLVCSKTLLTKMIPPERQGTVQGIYSAITRLALIGGPILGSAVFEKRIAYGAVASVICFVTIIAWYHSIRLVNKRERKLAKQMQG